MLQIQFSIFVEKLFYMPVKNNNRNVQNVNCLLETLNEKLVIIYCVLITLWLLMLL